nr:YetF domain-containing protein [Robertmurraya kyonggiensis]
MEWILRAVVAYFFLLIVTRALGQRAISQLRPLDFAMALVIGNIIAHPLSDEHLGLKGSIITTIVLVALYIMSIFIILKWPWARKIMTPEPITIVKDGEIIYKGLKRARITLDLLLEELREEKIYDVKKVALAIWEAHGKFSIFLDPIHEPLTPSTMQTGTHPFDFPKTIIKEGKLNKKELQRTTHNEEWVVTELASQYHTEVKDVLLATLDSQDNLNVFLYK